jgi:hypothetical protein
MYRYVEALSPLDEVNKNVGWMQVNRSSFIRRVFSESVLKFAAYAVKTPP